MSHCLPRRLLIVSCLLSSLPLVGVPRAAAQDAIDPVEDLRQALRVEDVRAPSPSMLEFRQKNLEQKIASLETIGNLRRALALDEWKEEPGQGRNELLRQLDEQMRKLVGRKLQEGVRRVVDKGAPNARLAAANMMAELGPSIRALDITDRSGFARSLTPEAVRLARDPDRAVRQEGLRALGTINPVPDLAVDVFREALKSSDVDQRMLAGQGLVQMMRVTNQLRKRNQTAARVEASERDVLTLAQKVVPLCRAAIADPEAKVRIAGLDGIRQAALGVVDMVYEPFSRKVFPPEGRRLSDEEVKDILATYEVVRKEAADVDPVFKVLQESSPLLVAPLSDSNAAVRQACVGALEAIAWGRLKEKRRLDSVPLPTTYRSKLQPLTFIDPLEPFLAKGGLPATARMLRDSEVRTRRMTLDFVENLDDSAVPLIADLGETLSDPDRFVRWAAARVLGALPAEKAQVAVPSLARLLLDPDLSVRQAAAGALEAMGPLAAPAIDLLAPSLLDGDVESRIMVMGVLVRLPPAVAKTAAPQMRELLVHPDPRLRKAAAESVGRFGPFAEPAIPALRRLLGDENSDVRSAASDAILAILAPVK